MGAAANDFRQVLGARPHGEPFETTSSAPWTILFEHRNRWADQFSILERLVFSKIDDGLNRHVTNDELSKRRTEVASNPATRRDESQSAAVAHEVDTQFEEIGEDISDTSNVSKTLFQCA